MNHKGQIKIIIIGPFPDPISGVSLSNKKVKDIFVSHDKFSTTYINMTFPFFEEKLGKFTFKKFFYFFILNLKIYKIFKVNKVYITPGQTFFGLIKYAPFIILSWILNKSAVVSPIIGATKLSHISDAVSSIDIELSGEDIKKLESAYQPRIAEPNI